MILGLFANLSITAAICRTIELAVNFQQYETARVFLLPAAIAAAGAAVRYAASRGAGELRDTLGRRAKKELRERVYGKIVRLGVRSADGMSMAGLTQVAMEGVEQLDLYYSSYIPQFLRDGRTGHPLLRYVAGGLAHGARAARVRAAHSAFDHRGLKICKEDLCTVRWGKYTSMGDAFLDSVQGMRELKIFRADAARQKKMNETSEEFRRITMKVLTMQLASTTIMDLVAYGGAGAGIAVAVTGVLRRGLSPFAALFLILTAVEFSLPLRAFGAAFHVAMNGVSAGGKILSLLDKPEPVWGRAEAQPGELRLENVSFSYDGQRDVLHDVSMAFPRTGMTAIVGPSGCGKSTVVNLLTGALRPQSGRVMLGGASMESLSRESYYAHLAVVSCGSHIFNDIVRANFRLANAAVTDEAIWAALETVNLASFVRENGGLDKVIAEDAANLSGGQKQRLALAVNLTAERDIYILDEATSNIDIESEEIIMKAVAALAKEKAVILISHRLANVVPAEKIYAMESGGVAECGTHAALMASGGGYAKLYAAQKALEEGYREDEE